MEKKVKENVKYRYKKRIERCDSLREQQSCC